MNITLAQEELRALTGYAIPTKQLRILISRGFYRAFISRSGGVVLERSHYEAVTKGQEQAPPKAANTSFMRGKHDSLPRQA